MPTDPIIIPVSTNSLFKPDPLRPVQGGNTRLVPLIPIGEGKEHLPCIWKSHDVKDGTDSSGQTIRVYECLLLVSRNPVLTLRAEVAVEAWQHFSLGPVEW